MKKHAANDNQDKKQGRATSLAGYIGLIAVTTVCTIVLSVIVLVFVISMANSRREHAELLDIVQSIESDVRYGPVNLTVDDRLRQINPDFICWITVEGTSVDYPVVRGVDNNQYLNMSFSGEFNLLGSLFMDYRCVGEYVPHIIIYGHNSQLGDKFGELWMFLDPAHIAAYPVITLRVNDRIVEYEIFSAKITDVDDPAYFLDFRAPGSFRAFAERVGAPEDATQIITLSTCLSGNNEDERIIVQGALRGG